jgi:hypothetical protein
MEAMSEKQEHHGREGRIEDMIEKGDRVGNLGRTICGFGSQNKHKEKSTASI